jgi:RNase H-fold protein (predicted Holliday junction resolvase)
MIIAIDPGSDKTGLAVLAADGALLFKQIVPTEKLISVMAALQRDYPFDVVVMGNGTNHKRLQPLVEQWIQIQRRPIMFSLVDEQYTTVEGRRLYWQYTKRHGWRRFIPASLQYPPDPVDDFVAWIIGKRFIMKQGVK